MENPLPRLLLTSCAVAFATAASFAPHSAQAMTIATPAGLSAAIQQSDVKQNVYWRRGYWGFSYYRPYAFAYRPYATLIAPITHMPTAPTTPIGPTLTAMLTGLMRMAPMPMAVMDLASGWDGVGGGGNKVSALMNVPTAH